MYVTSSMLSAAEKSMKISTGLVLLNLLYQRDEMISKAKIDGLYTIFAAYVAIRGLQHGRLSLSHW